jgi:Domain of unknown function (DUF6046)
MPIINGIPLVDPEVQYAGHTIPPKPPLNIPGEPVDPFVVYNGNLISRMPQPFVPIPKDLTNNPSFIFIGQVVTVSTGAAIPGLQLQTIRSLNGFQLPLDTIITLNGKKILAESQIIDGVSVFEHISRKPYEITFDFTIRPKGTQPGVGNPAINNPFPQVDINNLWTLWETNTVQTIQNTYLNGLKITSIIIQDIQPATVRGSLNIPVKLKVVENQHGQTIII